MPDSLYCHPSALVESDRIGEGTRVWAFAHVMAGAVVGHHCNVGNHAFIESGAVVGNEVTIKNGVAIWAHVTVKDRVFLGPYVVLTNDARPRSRQPWTPVATVIDEGAAIGANATIVCGCHVGAYALVGAGAVVTRPVPAQALVVGNPARVVGHVCRCGQSIAFTRGAAACASCGLRYLRTRLGVTLDDGPAAPGRRTAPRRRAASRPARR